MSCLTTHKHTNIIKGTSNKNEARTVLTNTKPHIETPYSTQNTNTINPQSTTDHPPPQVLLPLTFALCSIPIRTKTHANITIHWFC